MPEPRRTNLVGQSDGRDDVQRVKDASDIVRIIGEGVALKPKGREYVGLCPFHDDHRPSMGVIPSKQIFHCFVCGAGGDVFSFVQKFHKLEFREALEFLADKCGLTLTPLRAASATSDPGTPGRKELLAANTEAVRYFRSVLSHPALGQAGRSIITRRGISPEMIEAFQVGLASDGWDGFLNHGRARKITEASMLAAGLIKRRDNGSGCYDLLRNRLIFPIFDKSGRPVAFGGRKVREEDEPKYLNSPETPLFNKSATLYALHLATPRIQSERTAIICEGYTDVIACHQAGFSNAVATLGTALTREHARELRLRCDTVILLFDGDDAGQRAADRAVPIFFAEPIDVKIATLAAFTDAKDPDELLKRPGGAEIFKKALAGAIDLLEYRFARVRARLANVGLSALEKGIMEELAQLADMGLAEANPVRRALVEKRLSQLSGLDESAIRAALPAGRSGRRFTPTDDQQSMDDGRAELAQMRDNPLRPEEHLLGCILCDPALHPTLESAQHDLIRPQVYRWALLRRVAQTVIDLAEAGHPTDLHSFLLESDDLLLKDAATLLQERIDRETDRDRNRLRLHWAACLTAARQQQASRMRPESDVSSILSSIETKRASHQQLGANRRVLPRG